ncbi:hypothetical protein PENTCL1PPCAC_16104, partial [Pristionchus entomophagus]
YELEMSAVLVIFDYCQTITITVCLVITTPLAFFVYLKLLVIRPFSENYTFKLIVINGIAELLNCVIYLINYQLTNYPFMLNYYIYIQQIEMVTPLAVIHAFLDGLSLHTTLFIALNRLKTILFIRRLSNDSMFFLVSIILSFSLALPSIFDYCFTTTVVYRRFRNSSIVFPSTTNTNDRIHSQILQTVSTIIRIVVSLASLLVNMFLAVLITRERKYIDIADRNKFNGEKGLVITSIVSYVFYMLYFANNIIAQYFDVRVSGYSQWLFLGLNSLTPFWCLVIFTPSVRRLLFQWRNNGRDAT